MPRVISPPQIGIGRITSVQATEVTREIDLSLGVGEAIAIDYAYFLVGEAVHVPATAFEDRYGYFSVHLESGNLEDGPEVLAAVTQLRSEMIAQAVLMQVSQDEAATRGGSSYGVTWLSTNEQHYLRDDGRPLLVAINPVLRGITSDSDYTINGLRWIFHYSYVELTDAELEAQFVLRR